MRRLSLLAFSGLFLINCNCESTKQKGEEAASGGESVKAVDLLDHLPPKDLGFLVHIPKLGQSLAGLGRHAGIVLDALGDKSESFSALKQQLGFNPMVPTELSAAGIKADGAFVIWGGAPAGDETWQPHIVFEVSDEDALIKTVTALAKREAALQMEPAQVVDEGKWYGLFRTFGKKKEPQGGLLLRKDPAMAILTAVDLPSLQAFLKVKGAVNDHPEWLRFRKRSTEPADATVLITTLGAGRAMAEQASVANLKVMPYLIKMGFESSRFWVSSHQIMDGQTVALTKMLQPEPPMVPAPPQGAVLAAAGSLDLGETSKQLMRHPLVGGQMAQLDTTALNEVFAALGSTYRVYLGLSGEPGSNPMILLGQSYFGLDVIGKDPSSLRGLLPQLAEKAGLAPGQLVPTDKGYSVQTPAGMPVEIELNSGEKRLSIRFGNGANGSEKLTGVKSQLTLPKGTLSTFYLDLTRLGKVATTLQGVETPMKSVMAPAAKILSNWSYLLVDQRLDKDYHVQTLQIGLP